MLVKKLFGNDLVGRSVKYLIKCPYYYTDSQLYTAFSLCIIL